MKLHTFLFLSMAALGSLFPSSSYAVGLWDCDIIADGPPGSCPDCMFICGRLLDADTLEIAILVDDAQSGVLCAVEVVVEQESEGLFHDEVTPSSPISLTSGWHAVDVVETSQSGTTDELISVIGAGSFAATAGACD